jgi:hypothetical protein
MNPITLVWISEWIKLRSVRSTWWAVSGALLAMALAAALDGTSTANEMATEAAPPRTATYVSLAISGVNFVQFIVPVPAMLLITSEYASRSITFSLQCVPARTRLLLGKAGIVAAFGFVLGTLLGVVGVAVGVPALGAYGHFSGGDTIRSVLAIGLYCGMICMVALGVGTFTRSSAATVSILFLVLLVASTLLGGLGGGSLWLGLAGDDLELLPERRRRDVHHGGGPAVQPTHWTVDSHRVGGRHAPRRSSRTQHPRCLGLPAGPAL